MPFNRLNHSILGEIRPRFSLKIECEPEIAFEAITDALRKDKTVVGDQANRYAFLKIPKIDQHYWSPEMSVRIERDEYSDDVEVHCLVGPKQSIWALWAFIYTSFALFGLFGAIYGYVVYKQDDNPYWLWTIPISILLIASAFLVAKFGQKKGRDQMLHLVSFLYHSLANVSKIERIDD